MYLNYAIMHHIYIYIIIMINIMIYLLRLHIMYDVYYFIYLYEHFLSGASGASGGIFFLAAEMFDVPRNALKRPRWR